MKTLIARKLHDALGVTVYTDTVPQYIETPSVVVCEDSVVFEGMQNGWVLCKGTYELFLRNIPCEAVAEALEFVSDREGNIYRAEELYSDGGFFAVFRYRARTEQTTDAAPMMQEMTQKTEVYHG